MKIILTLHASLILCSSLLAGPRNSTNYSITTDVADSAGGRISSANYSSQSSAGQQIGVSTMGSVAAKHGYIGQLYELLGYGLLATDYYPPEVSTTQLITVRTTDEGSNVVIPTARFSFVPLAGPIPSVTATGLVNTSIVFQNTEAIVGATSPLFAGLLVLHFYVQDTIPDNYSTYAGDGIGDDWQVQYFGLDNPLAAAGLDPDGDGQTNIFEYTAGLDPTDASSRFEFRIESIADQPSQRRLIISPRLAGRSYHLKTSLSLDEPWEPIGAFDISDDGAERTFIDLEALAETKFYRVEITKP